MKKRFNKKGSNKISTLRKNRGYLNSIIKNPNRMRARTYKTNKIFKFPGRPDLKVDTITEVYLSLDKAKKCGLLRYESEDDDDSGSRHKKIQTFL